MRTDACHKATSPLPGRPRSLRRTQYTILPMQTSTGKEGIRTRVSQSPAQHSNHCAIPPFDWAATLSRGHICLTEAKDSWLPGEGSPLPPPVPRTPKAAAARASEKPGARAPLPACARSARPGRRVKVPRLSPLRVPGRAGQVRGAVRSRRQRSRQAGPAEASVCLSVSSGQQQSPAGFVRVLLSVPPPPTPTVATSRGPRGRWQGPWSRCRAPRSGRSFLVSRPEKMRWEGRRSPAGGASLSRRSRCSHASARRAFSAPRALLH